MTITRFLQMIGAVRDPAADPVTIPTWACLILGFVFAALICGVWALVTK